MRYKIICKNCQSDQVIDIDGSRQINWGNADRIISGRYRLDNQWGFQCFCGNNDLMTKQEKKMITNHLQPDPKEVEMVMRNARPQKMQFAMEKL